MEEWKDIPKYENHYQVSNLGKIRSVDRVSFDNRRLKGKVIKTSINRFGYKKFNVSTKEGQKQLRVHRCVLEAFNPTITNNLQVNHIDGNKLNNRLSNLEWCTDSENKLHAYANGLMTPHNQYTK